MYYLDPNEEIELTEEDFEYLKMLDDNIFISMTPAEFKYMLYRAGVSYSEVGKCAVKIGIRDKPFHPSTICNWLYGRLMSMKAVNLLYNCMTHEQFVTIRKEWVKQRRYLLNNGYKIF